MNLTRPRSYSFLGYVFPGRAVACRGMFVLPTDTFVLVVSDVSPMSQRNFPASFWNSSYQGSLSGPSHHDLSSLHPTDPYMASSLHTMSSLHHQDPWRTYSGLSSATQPHTYTPHASMHDLAYSSMSASRFNAHYGSLLPSAAAASRLHGGMSGQCDLSAVKHSAADSWSSRYATDALSSHVHDAHAVHSAATSIPGGKYVLFRIHLSMACGALLTLCLCFRY